MMSTEIYGSLFAWHRFFLMFEYLVFVGLDLSFGDLGLVS